MTTTVAHPWEYNHLHLLTNEEEANAVLDLCVKLSSNQAIRLFQQALNEVAGWHGHWLPVTGIVGPYTIQLANELNFQEVLAKLKELAKGR
jgi:hypothetical protein